MSGFISSLLLFGGGTAIGMTLFGLIQILPFSRKVPAINEVKRGGYDQPHTRAGDFPPPAQAEENWVPGALAEHASGCLG